MDCVTMTADFALPGFDVLKADDEPGRLLALGRYGVLQGSSEGAFGHIVSLVQQTLRVPAAAVSLVYENRQWFKARRGLMQSTTPRDVSFCAHAIQRDEPFIVTDTLRDARFHDNPLVTGQPGIRAYLGIPLRTPDGYNLGTLCAIDTKRHDFTAEDVETMRHLAALVVDALESHEAGRRDALTGLLTRRNWMDAATTELERAQRYGRQLSVAILDIDRFRVVNEANGHAAGDRVLRTLGQMVGASLRRPDLPGRIGGEEIALLLPETRELHAATALDRIRVAFAAAATELDTGAELLCRFSGGVTELQPGDTLPQLLRRADQALRRAKAAGGNQIGRASGAEPEPDSDEIVVFDFPRRRRAA